MQCTYFLAIAGARTMYKVHWYSCLSTWHNVGKIFIWRSDMFL